MKKGGDFISQTRDIADNEIKFLDLSFSSIEDVYYLLNRLDEIYITAYDGNYQALVLLTDFKNLVNKLNNELHKKIIFEYLTIQSGQKPLSNNDSNYILKKISERLKIKLPDIENELLQTLQELVNVNYKKWKEWVLNLYILINTKERIKKMNNSEFSKIDNSKYLTSNGYKKNVKDINNNDYPEDLKELISYERYNRQKINELKEIKKDLSNEQKIQQKIQRINEEIRKRTNMEIQLHKDISILKHHYEIPIKSTNKKGETKKYPYNENYIQDNINNISDYNISDVINLEKIYNIAEDKLTHRQYIIFNLYYKIGFTQNKISKIIGEDQRNISTEIQRIIDKLYNSCV